LFHHDVDEQDGEALDAVEVTGQATEQEQHQAPEISIVIHEAIDFEEPWDQKQLF
jgi:hypothetical protein